MAYSDTINQTKVNVGQLIQYAFRASGKTAEEQTPEYINAAKQALFYILQNLSNRGVNLWMLKSILLGTSTDQTVLTLPPGTIDVREANWRYIVTPQIAEALPVSNPDSPALFTNSLDNYATSTALNNWFGAAYTTSQRIFQVGFNAYCPGTTATYNLVLETSEDGVNWTLRETFPETTLADGQWAYFAVDPSTPHLFFRLRETVETTFSLRQIVFSYTQQDIPLARLNRDDYWNLPNKQFPSQRPLQYWFDRQIDPQMYLWPIPNNDFQVFQLVIETQLQDVGNLTNELYVPNRWIAAIQAWLTHELSLQLPGVDLNRITYLEGQYEKWLKQAEDEERDKSPIYFQPNYSYYTR
jgi:hypothetical protein